ncbi:rpmG [Symbiodinium sp. CCMP2456]|nr:rpmG [Symbiodinium sp. CCMP2456]
MPRLLTCAALLQVASAGVAFVSPVNLKPGADLAPRTATSSTWKAKASGSWREASGAGVSFAAALLVGASFARAAAERATSLSPLSMAAHRKPTKKGRKIAVIECVEQRQMVKDGVPGAGGPRGGVSRYYTEKNVRNTPELLKLRKFNKYLGRHTLHVEIK